MTAIGVISDTHGLLRPEALAALQGSNFIVHAGDIGDPAILDRLNEIAPVTAVRGNVDHGAWAEKIPQTNVLEVEGISIYVLHILDELDLKPDAGGFAAVICGHSHVPKQDVKNGVLYFNPGSAGPKRFDLPVSLGKLIIRSGKIQAQIIKLI
jgi:putative phosphoesterase